MLWELVPAQTAASQDCAVGSAPRVGFSDGRGGSGRRELCTAPVRRLSRAAPHSEPAGPPSRPHGLLPCRPQTRPGPCSVDESAAVAFPRFRKVLVCIAVLSLLYVSEWPCPLAAVWLHFSPAVPIRDRQWPALLPAVRLASPPTLLRPRGLCLQDPRPSVCVSSFSPPAFWTRSCPPRPSASGFLCRVLLSDWEAQCLRAAIALFCCEPESGEL